GVLFAPLVFIFLIFHLMVLLITGTNQASTHFGPSYISSSIAKVLLKTESAIRRFQNSLNKIVNDPADALNSLGFSAVPVDVANLIDESEDPQTFGQQLSEAVAMVLQLHRQKNSNLIRSHVVFFNTNPNLFGIEQSLRVALSKSDNLSFEYRGPDQLVGWN